VPNSPEVVQIKSPSIATICLDEPFQPTIVTDIVNNCDDFNNIVKSTEVKAQSSTSAKRINEDDTCISLFATDEYVTGRFVKLEHMFQTWNHRHSK
jgi:hypothetical protein